MLRYVAPTYEERSSRLARRRGHCGDPALGALVVRADARAPWDWGPRLLARRIAAGLHGDRSREGIVARARAVAVRRGRRWGPSADVLRQERRCAAVVAGRRIDRIHLGSRRRC